MLKENLSIAIEAAIAAGNAIMEIYNGDDFDVQIKGDSSPLTLADIASHDIIEQFLAKTNIPVLSEEGKSIPYDERKNWSLLWIVDPIDGTKEFIKRNGEFTVNIALVENQIPVAGVVYAPALQELYFSDSISGAFKVKIDENVSLNELINKADKLPSIPLPSVYTVVASRSHLSPETEEYINELKSLHGNVEMVSKGSSLKLCMVAEGKAHCYPRFAPTMEWDTAAGHAICKYAGFEVKDWVTKNEMLYNRENLLNNWFLVK